MRKEKLFPVGGGVGLTHFRVVMPGVLYRGGTEGPRAAAMDHAGPFKINLSRRYAEPAFRKRCTRIDPDGMEMRMSVALAIRYNMTITSGTTVRP
jgi:hypothetical protein